MQPFERIRFDCASFYNTCKRTRTKFSRHNRGSSYLCRYNYQDDKETVMTIGDRIVEISSAAGSTLYDNHTINVPVDGLIYYQTIFTTPTFFNVPFEVVCKNNQIVITDIRQISYHGRLFNVPPKFVRKAFSDYCDDIVSLSPRYNEANINFYEFYLPKYFNSLDEMLNIGKLIAGHVSFGYIIQNDNIETVRKSNNMLCN